MSKRELKVYLKELNPEQLQDQILDLYNRFKNVKEYYDFAFNPKEDKLSQEIRFLISKEYFPLNGRRPKARRSVAQKKIKHIIQLGVDPQVVADVMLFNIEIAQTYSDEVFIKAESFYKSFLKSYEDAIVYIIDCNLKHEFSERLEKICDKASEQDWINKTAFYKAFDTIG